MVRTGFALLLILAGANPPPEAAANGGVHLLYPPARSAHSGPVRLIVATSKDAPAPAATLDGAALTLQRLPFAETWQLAGKLKATAQLVGDRDTAALWVATLDPEPGAHTVEFAGQRVDLWRDGDAPPPPDFAPAYSHSPVGEAAPELDCAGCHDQPDGALASAPTPAACAACHDEDSVQLDHHHIAEPLSRCAMCHDPHGTTRPKMLVDTREALCSKCHESGHSKP